ncbi:MAG: hypothetical protein HY011_19015 [Acidobacteria bacterium]|nr:hypothetical protein [Acidobacteriota bacterium]
MPVISGQMLMRRARPTRWLPGEQEQSALVAADNSTPALVRRAVERTLPNPVTGTPSPTAPPPTTGTLLRRSVEAQDPGAELRNQALWGSLRAHDDAPPAEPPAPMKMGELLRRNLEGEGANEDLQARNQALEMYKSAPVAAEAAPDNDGPVEQLRRVLADEAERLVRTPRRAAQLPVYQPLERSQKTGLKNRLLGALEGAGQGFLQTGKVEGALGGALAGAVNRDGPHKQRWLTTEYPEALQREQAASQQDAQARREALEQFGSLTHAATALKALREPAQKPDPLTRFQFNPQSGVFYRTKLDGTLEYRQVDLPYTLPSGGKRFLGTQPIAANPVTPKPAAAPRVGQPGGPKLPAYTKTDAEMEQLAEDGSVEAIVENGLRERPPAIEANLPPGTLQLLQTGKKSKAVRDPATGKPVTVDVAATPQEIAAAKKLREDAIEKERKRMLVETRAVAQQKAARRYLDNRNGAPVSGAPSSNIEDVLLERRTAIEGSLPPGVLEMVQTGRKTKVVRDPATGREQELLTKATSAEIAAAQKIYNAAIERERQKLAAPAAQRSLNKRNSSGVAAPPNTDELNRYAEWLRGKGLSAAEIQQRLNSYQPR